MSDAKRERFIKVAETRVTKILDMLRLLKNCSNRNNYEYTEGDVELMFSQINKAVKEARESYSQAMSKSKPASFSFTQE